MGERMQGIWEEMRGSGECAELGGNAEKSGRNGGNRGENVENLSGNVGNRGENAGIMVGMREMR